MKNSRHKPVNINEQWRGFYRTCVALKHVFDMEENSLRALFEGAYAQTPTLPGFYVKYDEFSSIFKEQMAAQGDSEVDLEKTISEFYPDAKYEEAYQLPGTTETFKAFRIAPNRLTMQRALKHRIDSAIKRAQADSEGWVNFASVGQGGVKEECLQMGFTGLRQAVERLCRYYEFREGDKDKHEAPVYVRDKRPKVQLKEPWTSTVGGAALRPHRRVMKQGSYLGEALSTFAYFPSPKDVETPIYGWDAAVNYLADNLALPERWYHEAKDKITKPILKNYLSFTFERLQYEDTVLEPAKAVLEHRDPIKKILTNSGNAVWNTGLVDNVYDPIYAFFKANNHQNPMVTQDWIFIGFGTANSHFQSIITDFPYQPKAAQYFDNPRELFYDVAANRPTYGKEHIFRENIDRLPTGFLKKGAPLSFKFEPEAAKLPKVLRDDYYKRLSEAIYANEEWLQLLITRFNNALDIALSRVAWNYKTAIPMYYVNERKMQLMLPLALEKNGVIDVALVCNHKYDPSTNVNNYEGKTIFTLPMAYNNARLITRPDSDWLMADETGSK